MEMFKKQSVALLCMILMMVGSTLFKGAMDVNKETDQLEYFFMIDEGDGFSIQDTLESKLEFSNELANKFAIRFIDTDSVEIIQVNQAIEQLKEAKSISDKFDASVQLDQMNNQLIGLLEKQAMDEASEKELNRFYANLQNCNDQISHSLYNEKVMETEEELSGFLAGIIRGLFGIDIPDAYK